METCKWENISYEEFTHWKKVVRKTHKHTFYNELDGGKCLRYFIEDEGLSKIFILSSIDTYCGKLYYKNSNVIGS